ncbi:MAG: DNA cytosine methyltransferase [Halobacteriovoraceae bacterium]|mgnify:CR=1 FL=1|jgi:DNA (cytosine-5)-methyltransferase 1|nr:DNA cytosine methyltransferase [Halobacteriovoraceae bacterium]MBT5095756.1 DNA cytosine methyltransferase [Halobacteriovoraceae bacterium]
MPNKPLKKLNFIDVFAGAGGLSCGLEMTGMDCLLGVDYDKYAMQTFAKNHKKAHTYCGDIRKLSKKKLEDYLDGRPVHAVVGGPPCQGFSTVGLGDPKDQRNALFLQFVRIVRLTNPYFVVLENVTGLLAKKNENVLKNIFRQFNKLGYVLDVKVMSSDMYGVPERRRRTIIIGSRITENAIFPTESHNRQAGRSFIPPVTVGEAFKNLKTKKNEIFNHDLEWAELKSEIDKKRLARIPEGKGIRYQKDEKAFLTKALSLGVDWENLRENRFRQTKYQRLDRSKPGPTIMTHRHGYYHPTENRYLTQREAAAIQSFPNNFVFEGPISAQWRQIGNAVPPLLGKAIGKALIKMYKSTLKTGPIKTKNTKKIQKQIDSSREKAFVYRA